MLPVRGLTIRIKFERDAVPTSAWWYGEQNESGALHRATR